MKTTCDANLRSFISCTFFMLVRWLNSRNLGLEFPSSSEDPSTLLNSSLSPWFEASSPFQTPSSLAPNSSIDSIIPHTKIFIYIIIWFRKITQIVIFIILIILQFNWNINNFKLAISLNRIILELRSLNIWHRIWISSKWQWTFIHDYNTKLTRILI